MGRADAKAGLSDPAVLDGKAVAQQIKGTPGITGLSPLSVHSGEEVWHLNTLGCWTSNCLPTNRLITVNPNVGARSEGREASQNADLLSSSLSLPWQRRGKSMNVDGRRKCARFTRHSPLVPRVSCDPVTTDPKGKASIMVQAFGLYASIVAIRRLLSKKSEIMQ
jgi:hypothetical protein